MAKKSLLVLVLAIFVVTGAFAQAFTSILDDILNREGNGYIKPTFSLGFGAVSEGSSDRYFDAAFTIGVDVDFVNNFGLTFGLQNIVFARGQFEHGGDRGFMLTAAGIGYTFDSDIWSAGGKVMFSSYGGRFAAGFNVNGTYWFRENLGFSGILNVYFPRETMIFSLRAGISFRY